MLNAEALAPTPKASVMTAITVKAGYERATSAQSADRVHHIFQDHGHAAINSDITVSMPGGTVMGALGQPISYLTQPRSLSLQPTRTYLLLLSYHADGDFYTHVDDWDISDGIARPNTKISQAKAKEGTSISGLTTDALDRTLSQRLSEKR
jgi:hypothetical protein